ncbi:NYN domain [Mycobacteroides abscessus]|uniref:NYN domain n=1 Tax=Mycobacteroides abscessus subsp. massiliense TaxID=1962118 RepID=A0AB38DBB8_9MYCO|nr:NYN domain-containing protein [Mycobacteroides abscessus]MBN7343373.1 NYN domain-containing protein [Mycobacteroides abscessus subsp. massiliense]MBN7542115.1 NYN domain-containing protein [Mycobacteroides abscessus subsp. massiliense]MDB2307798.1 NYN domain-containing protein [Mycobacteroides abscessus subsp. massiliense]MDO2977864.1 NYN domain-containing protein [Mycobacteroides abscessus subsp. massiliense]MDO3361225.1 NYN domain-containing protein [Mycobacteroides abscessus subsp. massi
MTPDRVVVFIDYQNVYRSARRVYHDHLVDPHWFGQINPQALGEHLVQDSNRDRVLKQVRVYRGLPSNSRDSRGYSAARKQLAFWGQLPDVLPITRPLQYPEGWPNDCLEGEKPNEKGIDVQIALDMATMAQRKEYEAGVLVSLDTDLRPALEYVADLARSWGKPRAEVAAWTAEGQMCSRLSLSRQSVYCHWLPESVYQSVRDNTDYSPRR